MYSNHTPESPRVVKGGCEAAPGLVPYTTSDTQGSTLLELSKILHVSSRLSRLRRMKHHVRTASRLVKETMSRSGSKWRALFVTLTYRPGVDWSPRHITSFIKCAKQWASRRGAAFGYVWVAEVQRRGAVHYHLVAWLPSGLRLPRPDKRGWWKWGSTNVQSVKRNAVGYLMKYVSKGIHGDDPDLPSGARICGSGGLDSLARDEFHFWRLPRYVRECISVGDRCRRRPGGGWVCPKTGEFWRSDYGLFGVSHVSHPDDCNGVSRRDTWILLSDTYKRVKAPFFFDHALIELDNSIRAEEAFYRLRSLSVFELFPVWA